MLFITQWLKISSWRLRFQHDIQQMIPDTLTLNEMGRSTFNLILSFCFVGDIGYDPHDFSKTLESDSEISN
ncbi:MAG: hypothetical protein SFY66_20815 [Oculatellaceae cyanobacterium bins.114]|nr:hypothetical protein [Oculatellaceae cyanobacterium bins.114]